MDDTLNTVDWYNRFDAADRAQPAPENEEFRHMFFLVAYDICQPARLRKVAKICEVYGVRVEKSVFQCDLPQETFEAFWCELIDVVDEEDDAVVAYRICQSCLKQAESIGVVSQPQKRLCYIL
jgi:CRISPR-associated protein Cas2